MTLLDARARYAAFAALFCAVTAMDVWCGRSDALVVAGTRFRGMGARSWPEDRSTDGGAASRFVRKPGSISTCFYV